MLTSLRFSALEGFFDEKADEVCVRVAGTSKDEPRSYETITYRQLCERSLRLARTAQRSGLREGSCCVTDMGNCAAYLYLLLAAAFSGFSILALNARLDEDEKTRRISEACNAMGLEMLPMYDEETILEAIDIDRRYDAVEKMDTLAYLRHALDSFESETEALLLFTSASAGRPKMVPLTWNNVLTSASALVDGENAKTVQGLCQIVLPLYRADGIQAALSSLLLGRSCVLYKTFHVKQILRDAGEFGASHISVSWKMLDALLQEDERIALEQGFVPADQQITEEESDDSVFQENKRARGHLVSLPDPGAAVGPTDTFPPIEIGQSTGFGKLENADIALSENAEDYDPGKGDSGSENSADKNAASLCSGQDDLTARGQHGFEKRALARYKRIVFNEVVLGAISLQRIKAADARVYAGFGMAETSGIMALRLAGESFDCVFAPLPGYDVAVIAPDRHGYGKLAVKGAGVMHDYLNNRAPFTADRFFLTGDVACMHGDCMRVVDKTQGMFVADGESIYPEEIRSKMLQVPGVSDAYVFPQEDGEWGYKPVAVVEAADAAKEGGINLQLMTDDIRRSLITRMSSTHCPQRIVVVSEFPRSEDGAAKLDQLRLLYDQRIDIRKAEIWRLKLPLHRGMRLENGKVKERDLLVLRLTDWAGRTGIGEVASLDCESRLPETLLEDQDALLDTIISLVKKYVFLHPSQASVLLRANQEASEWPMACAAVESALWDIYGKMVHCSIAALIGGRECVTEPGSIHEMPKGFIPASIAIGVGSKSEVLEKVKQAVSAGYSSVKLSVRPGHDVAQVKAVRSAFPQLKIVLDAQQSYTEEDMDILRALDGLGLACIEEPLNPKYQPKVGPQDLWSRLVRLQRDMRTPLCLDESWKTADELKHVLQRHPSLRCVCLKLGKMGGVQPALEFYWWARERGIALRLGDLYESGVSRRLHAAFAMLPGMNLPCDIYDVTRYFSSDICNPPFVAENACIQVNEPEHPYGLGCSLDDAALNAVCLNKWEL